jgi:hypothetical protein
MRRIQTIFALVALCGLTALAAGCDGSGSDDSARPAPPAAEFPSAKGETIDSLLKSSGAKPSKLVVAPAAAGFDLGPNRYPFGVFTLGMKQVDDADIALYFAKDSGAPVQGPLPAEVSSLETKPAYRAAGSEGPEETQTVYVVPRVDFDRDGPWLALAMLKGPNGLEATRPTASPVVGQFPDIPQVGDQAPVIHTPTADDVGGDLSKIDTRIPPDQMHEIDFADVVGKKPVVLVFATPAFCQSRVCGPVVDEVQEVADKHGDEAAFIHMEIYEDNDPSSEEARPQLAAFGLETEPWTFLIDKNGIVRDRIEGAFGVSELEEAMKKILPG